MVLDSLKDVWKNQKESKIQFTETDIYKMIHQKSASIVKWIFYISAIEFLLLMLPNFFMDNNSSIENLHLTKFINTSIGLSVFIGLIFVYLFYKNYKNICVNDSTKKLMNDILKTRKTVKFYVISQLVMGAITMFMLFFKISFSNEIIDQLPENTNRFVLWLIFIFIGAIILLLVWLFYKLIYGILLERLNQNYLELKKNELLEN